MILLAALVALPLASAALPAPVPVAAAGFSFLSPALVVPAGSTVEWTGAALPHTVTSAASLDDARAGIADGAFDADLPMGAAYARTFASTGDQAYFCRLHYRVGMIGQISVV